jgi:DNA gyrase subunit B
LKNSYNEDSIQKLDPLSFTRLRPDTYCGSTEDSTQLWQEIVLNCTDEFLAGNCDEIVMTIDDNNIITVSDNGQGILPNVKKDGNKTVLEMVYGDINTSGKYDKSEDAVYKVSTGAFGIGACLTNFLSHWLTVTTKRDGEFETIHFKEGKFDNRVSGTCEKNEHGVTVSFHPSEEFFKNPKPSLTKIKESLFNISCVCSGLTLYFNGEKFYNSNGLSDLLSKKIGKDVQLISSPFTLDKEIKNQRLILAMSFGSKVSSDFYSFCNYSPIEAGTPVSAVKSCITRVLNKWGQDNNLLKSKESLPGSALQEGISVVFNLISPNIRYDSQTKVRVTSTEDNSFINSVLGEQLELWLDNNPEDGKNIIEKALLARKASEAARKAREAVKNKTKAANNKVKIMNPDKLKDAEFLGQDSTLLLVEGLSAGASMAVARETDKYGILMLRGKLINAFTNKDNKLEKNEEIQLLFKALGITPGHYDSSKLRYGRIAITVDSDSDGYHIGLLIMAALQHFCPEFIEEGRLCWLRSPLYIVKNKGKETYYFTDEEMDAARDSIVGEVQRNKGLGSLSAEQARASMFGENQKMDILKVDNGAISLLKDLMGNSITKRKDFIFNNIDFSEVRE